LRLLYELSEWLLLQVRPWSVRHVEGHLSSTQSGNGSGTVDADVYVIDGPIRHHDINVVERVNFLPEGTAPASAVHGTHVAGIIGAIDDINGIVGIAPGARIHSLEVMSSDGTTTMSALLDAVEFLIQRKRAEPSLPMVVNIAIGRNFRTTRLNALDHAIAAAVDDGVVVVVSAGNAATNASTFSPAHAPGAITVGATTRSDDFASSFSNWGSTVDILAPGEDILSVTDGGLWATMSGTSMASAHVSGAAALFMARNPGMKPSGVQDAMIRLADQASDVPGGTTDRRLNVGEL
jgi:subtilisin family serine protease